MISKKNIEVFLSEELEDSDIFLVDVYNYHGDDGTIVGFDFYLKHTQKVHSINTKAFNDLDEAINFYEFLNNGNKKFLEDFKKAKDELSQIKPKLNYETEKYDIEYSEETRVVRKKYELLVNKLNIERNQAINLIRTDKNNKLSNSQSYKDNDLTEQKINQLKKTYKKNVEEKVKNYDLNQERLKKLENIINE
jgi:hypothetical protein